MKMKMKRSQPGKQTQTRWYDFYDDWDLIESSLAEQYGIRIRREILTIKSKEVFTLVSGLLPETPLGRVISIRSETDKNALKNYTPEMKKIRSDWLNKQAKIKEKDVESLDKVFKSMEKQLEVMFGNKK